VSIMTAATRRAVEKEIICMSEYVCSRGCVPCGQSHAYTTNGRHDGCCCASRSCGGFDARDSWQLIRWLRAEEKYHLVKKEACERWLAAEQEWQQEIRAAAYTPEATVEVVRETATPTSPKEVIAQQVRAQ